VIKKGVVMNGAEVITEILRREGTDFLSCYPRNPLIESCADIGIRPILCRQERVGAGIADGYSRTTNGKSIGVFASQAGPGIENTFAGVAQAFCENIPLLVIPGGSPLSHQYTRPVFSATDNYRHITKWVARVHHVQEIPRVMRRAYHLMRSGKSGPVLIEVPPEVWEGEFEGELDYRPPSPLRAAPDPSDVEGAAKRLVEADRPVIFAGAGILWSGATEELIAVAELLDAPVLTTNPGKSAFPETHPLSLGASAVSASKPLSEYLRGADVVFAVGTSLTTSPFNPNVPPGKRIIHATNHEDDINKDHAAERALLGDAKLTLAMLADALKDRAKPSGETAKAVKHAKVAWLAEWEKFLKSDEVPLNPYRVAYELMTLVDRDNTIVTHDSGSPREQLVPFWETTKPRTYMGWGKSTQLGYGLGLNMGAKLAAPEKLCINVMGDCAIGMVGMDIEMAVRNGIAIMTVVFNNGVMAVERSVLKISDEKYGTMAVGGNYYEVAKGLGAMAFRSEKPEEIVPIFKEAIAATEDGKTVLVEFLSKENQDFSQY
jgi:acetolactate synthase-1/2/3 large subunit